jgi:hypothetical protein
MVQANGDILLLESGFEPGLEPGLESGLESGLDQKMRKYTGNCHYPTFLFHKMLRTLAKCSTTSKLNTPRFDNYANHLA